jgi:hypothetical protein
MELNLDLSSVCYTIPTHNQIWELTSHMTLQSNFRIELLVAGFISHWNHKPIKLGQTS